MSAKQQFSLNSCDDQAKAVVRMSIDTAKENNFRSFGLWTFVASLWTLDGQNPNSISAQLKAAGLNDLEWGNDIKEKLTALPRNAPIGTNPTADADIGALFTSAQNRAGARLITVKDFWVSLLLSNREFMEHSEKFGLTVEARHNLLKNLGVGASEIAEDSALAKYCKDLTAAAASGELDPIIGRDEEIREGMNIVQRRTKNNPIFVGEPGVGKTALVEGLAQRMIKNEVPETLKDKVLLSLDVGSLLAGAKYKGELEERVKNLVREIQERDDVVLFIDEIHTLVNSSGEASAVGQLLKPALARGELRCIGATTPDEYRQYLEKDPALERRFQKVSVLEPSIDDAVAILRGIKDRYALHHGVDITDSAIVAAVELSSRYITDRQLPDKAIDLMDAAAARVRTVLDSKPEEMDRLDRRLVQLKVQRETLKKEEVVKGELDEDTQKRLQKIEADIQGVEQSSLNLEERWLKEKELHDNILSIQEDLASKQQDLDRATRAQDLVAISEIQYGVIPQLNNQLRAAKKELRTLPNPLMQDQVNEDQISEVVSRRTGIPVAKMKDGEQEKLAQMEEILGGKVIGQPAAVEAVSDAVRRSRSGLTDPNRPIGSFLFLGPTGVGKTELCKVLSTFLFDRKDAMVRIDMSEFMEKHSVSRLIGAPPGYVGYEEGGRLTEAIRQHPYSVILLDEVEKAHPDVFNILLQVLDDGHLTDGQGRTVDFKNTVIIMTSNLGASDIQELTANGASADDIKDSVMENVKKFFRPEFINRLDESVVFRPLDRPDIARIAQLQINQLVKRLGTRKIDTVISDAAVAHLAEAGFDPLMGARPLKRAIQQELENPLAKEMVSGRVKSGDQLFVDSVGGSLTWKAVTPEVVNEDDQEVEATVEVSVSSTPISPASLAEKTSNRRAKKQAPTKAKMA